MIKDNIEKKLRSWFSQMTKKYTWLRIKFEFNENRGVFMVSFSPKNHIEDSDEFNIDAMQFADKMNVIYGNEELDRRPVYSFVKEVENYPGLLDIIINAIAGCHIKFFHKFY